ncbi:hypothetical protein BV25DRAFT_1912314 [Artomyces pyxidatus]|uniref:Uncharacterized protein n=1 Tax=Artomyces pyxidatus TaxID=48021 RepID=A0ACB8TEX6_9AGAM|nr:hypothetical protein BV25DRAFT_1912314 [Artomyces pyxidatus]
MAPSHKRKNIAAEVTVEESVQSDEAGAEDQHIPEETPVVVKKQEYAAGSAANALAESSFAGSKSKRAKLTAATPVVTKTESIRSKIADNVALAKRICSFLNYVNSADHTFSITMLPREIGWGPHGTPQANTICVENTAIPVVVWHVGEVTKMWFFDRQGEPADRVSVTFSPVTDAGLEAANRMIEVYSDNGGKGEFFFCACYVLILTPAKESMDPYATEIKAYKWQSVRVPGSKAPVATPFRRLYDATNKFQRKGDMRAIDPVDLRIGDVVLVEVFVTRYKQKADNRWKMVNDLRSLSVLKRGAPPEEVPEPEEAEFEGVM